MNSKSHYVPKKYIEMYQKRILRALYTKNNSVWYNLVTFICSILHVKKTIEILDANAHVRVNLIFMQ